MPISRKSRVSPFYRRRRGQSGQTLLEAILAAAILAIGMYGAISGFHVGVQNLVSAKRSTAGIDQVDNFLAISVATQVNHFMRWVGYYNNCDTNSKFKNYPAGAPLSSCHTLLPGTNCTSTPIFDRKEIEYFGDIFQTFASSSTLQVQHLVSHAKHSYGSEADPSTIFWGSGVDAFFQTGTGGFARVDGESDLRWNALDRCYNKQLFTGAPPHDFSNDYGIYFCLYFNPQGGNEAKVPNSIAGMHAFGEFIYTPRDLNTGQPITCTTYATNFAQAVSFTNPPSTTPFGINGELYYTLYWASDPPAAGHYHHYTGNAAVADTLQSP